MHNPPSHDCLSTNSRLSTLLLSLPIHAREGVLESGHPAQSHQVINPHTRLALPLFSHTIRCRSVRTILQVIQDDWDSIGPVKPTSPIPGFSRQNGSLIGPSTPSPQGAGDKEDREPVLTDAHRRLLMRLSPIVSMEGNLANKLFPHPPDPKEMSVRGGTNWKSYIAKLAKEANQKAPRPRSSQGSVPQEESTHVLVTFKEDIIALWNDPVVHRVLKRRGCNIRDMSGLCVYTFLLFQIRNLICILRTPFLSLIISRLRFISHSFLDDVRRIAVQDYEPSDR